MRRRAPCWESADKFFHSVIDVILGGDDGVREAPGGGLRHIRDGKSFERLVEVWQRLFHQDGPDLGADAESTGGLLDDHAGARLLPRLDACVSLEWVRCTG